MTQTLEAQMTLAREGAPFLGAARVALLEAVAREGSISGAARAVGMSYKGAWDAIEAMNNLSPAALVEKSAGGRHGGGARLTAHGEGLLRAYRDLEARLAQLMGGLELDAGNWPGVFDQLRRWTLKTSARNQLLGTVSEVTRGAVNAEVRLALDAGPTLTAIVTMEAVDDLGLAPGRSAVALIKASSLILLTDAGIRTSARNQLAGKVKRVIPGAVNAEVVVDIAGGKTLTAIVTQESARQLGLRKGSPVTALIKASSVILAVSD
jgi:molybdate transport system regulatory protein